MIGRIDVHAHLLPGLDDGSESVAESLAIARAMADAGYTHIVCTPHVWPHMVRHRPKFITERVAQLQAELDREHIAVKLLPGGELYVELDIYSMSRDEIPTFDNAGRFAIFDFWGSDLPASFWLFVERLRSLDIEPIVAHPERIECLRDDPERIVELEQAGLKLQGNLQSLSGTLGESAKRLGERLLTEGRYFMLGSDLHRMATLEPRLIGLRRAIELVGDAEVNRLTRINPANIVGIPLD